jgi:alcohol dehydrogenase class IV
MRSKHPKALETVFAMDSSAITIGPGVTREIGDDVRVRGCARAMLVTDSWPVDGPIVEAARAAHDEAGVACDVFDGVCVEPTDASSREAIYAAAAGSYDGFVAVGGRWVIDTAKAANLCSTYPADVLA